MGRLEPSDMVHSTVQIYVGDREEIIMEVSDGTTIGHVIEHAEQATGLCIEALSSPHKLRGNTTWARHDHIRELGAECPVFKEPNRITFIAILEGWDFERCMDQHRMEYGHYW